MEEAPADPQTSLVTEDEVDDDFEPAETTSKPSSKNKDDDPTKGEAEAAEGGEGEEAETKPKVRLLEGHWNQLQARAPASEKDGGRRRFLAWNAHGHVVFDPEHRRLEVVYKVDPSDVHRFKTSSEIQMAAVSPNACAVSSCEPGAPIHIYPRERWDKASFTAVSSSKDEVVEALACGDDFLAALTSARLLRLFSLTGLPLGVISMPGRSVALAARGFRLLVVTGLPGHSSSKKHSESDDGVYPEEALEYRLLDFRSRSERSSGRLPLSAKSGLRWIGFSEEILPLAIDTKGMVRALFAGGAGCWGPAGGSGGEWTIVADLAPEESKSGPLWAVDARQNLLLVAEAGQDLKEPSPEPAALADGDEKPLQPLFGQGAELREICWKLAMGPVSGCAQFLENATREGLMTEHLTEVHNSSLDAEKDDSAVASASSARLKAALTLFVQLVKSEDQERALDAAVHYLAVAGGSKQLSNAGAVAEKARLYKLADKLAALPRLAQVSTEAATSRTPHSLPKSVRQTYTPLFASNEGSSEQVSIQRSSSDVTTSDKLAQLKARSIDRKSSFNLNSSSNEELQQQQQQQEPLHLQPPPVNAIPTLPSATSPPGVGKTSSAVPAPSLSVPSAGVANPFARRTKNGAAAVHRAAPHLLRDALQASAPPLKMARLG